MQVFFLYYFRSILLFINTLIASAYIELTLTSERTLTNILFSSPVWSVSFALAFTSR